MNKFIKHDIENALSLMKVAINNALADVESGEESYIELGKHVPVSLVIAVAKERHWGYDYEEDLDYYYQEWEDLGISHKYTPDGKLVRIEGGCLDGSPTSIEVMEENESD